MPPAMQHAHWIALARAHWKEHLPEMFARLEKAGTLEATLREAADATAREMRTLVEQGATQTEAWEMVRQNHLLLAPEQDELAEPLEDGEGYATAAAVNQGLNNLLMPGERET